MNLYIKLFLICFLTVILPSCESNTDKPTPPTEIPTPPEPPEGDTTNNPPETKAPKTPQPETSTPPEPPEGDTTNDPPETKAPKTPQPETSTPPEPPEGDTANDPPETKAPKTPQPETSTLPEPPENEIVKGAQEETVTVIKANIKALDSLTLDDLEKNNLLGEDGSSLHNHFYMPYALFHAKEFLDSTNVLKAELPPLCFDEESCSKNLIDVTRLEHSHMAYLIKKIGLSKLLDGIVTLTKDETTFTVAFLQGTLDSDDMATNIDTIKERIEHMDQNDTRKILINLASFWKNTEIFFLLGEYIHKKQVDLHIVGQCTDLCARYLIPAAKTVIIGPYGHISYGGSHVGFYNTALEAVPRQEAYILNYINNPNTDDLYKFFVHRITQVRQLTVETQSATTKKFIDDLRNWDKDSTNKGTQVAAAVEDFLSSKGSVFITHLTDEDIKEFFRNLSSSPDLVKNLKSYIMQKAPYRQHGDQLMSYFKHFAKIEEDYYKNRTSIFAELSSQSKTSYSYFDFTDLVARLIQSAPYLNTFSVPRAYNMPEETKPFFEVLPSGDLLRNLGLNVQGENHIEMFDTDENSKQIFLYLNNERIESCKFFTDGISFTTKTLLECLGLE